MERADPGLDRRGQGDRRSAHRSDAPGRRPSDRTALDGDEGERRRGGPAAAGRRRPRRSTQDGREPLTIYLDPEVIKAVKMTALHRDSSASAIVADAVDAWLARQGHVT